MSDNIYTAMHIDNRSSSDRWAGTTSEIMDVVGCKLPMKDVKLKVRDSANFLRMPERAEKFKAVRIDDTFWWVSVPAVWVGDLAIHHRWGNGPDTRGWQVTPRNAGLCVLSDMRLWPFLACYEAAVLLHASGGTTWSDVSMSDENKDLGQWPELKETALRVREAMLKKWEPVYV